MINRESHLGTENKIRLITAMVRPILTYASPAWSTATTGGIKKLSEFYNRTLRNSIIVPRYLKMYIYILISNKVS